MANHEPFEQREGEELTEEITLGVSRRDVVRDI